MSNRMPQSYDTLSRVELKELIQSHELEIDNLRDLDAGGVRFGQCQVFPSEFQPGTGDGNSQQWSIAWSDLMMTMFILFVVLYCYQISFYPPVWSDTPGRHRASAVVGGERDISTTSNDSLGAPASLSSATKFKEGRLVLREKKLGAFASLDLVNDKTMRVNLTGDLLFDQGQSDLLPQARYLLLDLVPLLRLAPYKIEVVGHADRSAQENKYLDSWGLSTQRATNVAKTLMESGGLTENRFIIAGAGSSRPAFAATSSGNNSKNRRVEIILTLDELDDHVAIVKPFKTVLN
jgi:chemotaxis protein MotB